MILRRFGFEFGGPAPDDPQHPLRCLTCGEWMYFNGELHCMACDYCDFGREKDDYDD